MPAETRHANRKAFHHVADVDAPFGSSGMTLFYQKTRRRVNIIREAHASRVLAMASSPSRTSLTYSIKPATKRKKSSFRRDAETSTQGTCATQSRTRARRWCGTCPWRCVRPRSRCWSSCSRWSDCWCNTGRGRSRCRYRWGRCCCWCRSRRW